MVPFPTIPPSEFFGRKDFFDSLAFPWGKAIFFMYFTYKCDSIGT